MLTRPSCPLRSGLLVSVLSRWKLYSPAVDGAKRTVHLLPPRQKVGTRQDSAPLVKMTSTSTSLKGSVYDFFDSNVHSNIRFGLEGGWALAAAICARTMRNTAKPLAMTCLFIVSQPSRTQYFVTETG